MDVATTPSSPRECADGPLMYVDERDLGD